MRNVLNEMIKKKKINQKRKMDNMFSEDQGI